MESGMEKARRGFPMEIAISESIDLIKEMVWESILGRTDVFMKEASGMI
jgi:hypothetical protein